MGIQTVVNVTQGFGIIGERYDNSPVRSQPFMLNSASAANNVFGRAFTVLSEGVARAGNPGGTNVFAGILVNPKSHALLGSASNTLAASLTLANNVTAEIANMGCFVVTLPTASSPIGNLVIYDNTTGVLETIAPGADLPVGKSSAYAVVDRFDITSGLAVIRMTTIPEIPVLA